MPLFTAGAQLFVVHVSMFPWYAVDHPLFKTSEMPLGMIRGGPTKRSDREEVYLLFGSLIPFLAHGLL
jgi:hypothetical protein